MTEHAETADSAAQPPAAADAAPETPAAGREEALLAGRAAKLQRLRDAGLDPYPPRFRRSCDNAAAIAAFLEAEAAAPGASEESESAAPQSAIDNLSLAGRVVSLRVMGRAAFLDLQDASGSIQALLRRNNLPEGAAGFELLKNLDLGDHLGVTGRLIRTRTGEITIDASEIALIAKGLRPLPEKYHGLRDTETRYRQRYLDLIANREIMPVFAARSRIISGIRRFLDGRGFLEVDTPVLVPVAAGAHARPFATHHNALDQQLYLRIATELYLKRLIVGGFDKVYEIGRVFRNEGIDQDHNPEFTLLESYEAYADYHAVMALVEQLVSQLAVELHGTAQVNIGGQEVDFTPPWRRVTMKEAILNSELKLDLDEALKGRPNRLYFMVAPRAKSLGIEMPKVVSDAQVIDKIISALVEPHLIQPTFLVDYPAVMSPLAKAKPENPAYVERFEAFVGGMEIANAYSELNDPQVQRQRFDEQDAIRFFYGDEEVDRRDDDFLTAMEYGMPPTGGLGIGIDRLTMLLTGQRTIRDVLLFPQMRPPGN